MSLPPIHLWNVDAALEPLSGGHRNAVFRTSGLDQDFVFKSTRRSEGQLRWLTPVQDAAEAAGIIVPRLIATRDRALNGESWTCEPFIDGRPFQPEELPQIAGQIAAFHLAAKALPQRPEFCASYELEATSLGGDADMRALPEDIAELCLRAWAALDGPTGVVHGDLGAGNLIHTTAGPALIDWDEARVDALSFDRIRTQPESATAAEKSAALAWEVASGWGIEPEHARLCARVLKARI